MRVYIYARVSSVQQADGSSLADQQRACEQYAASRGLSISKAYVEAESGVFEKVERREQMQALLRDVRSGDLILVDKVDRWSRDPAFTYESVRKLHKLGAKIYFVGDACDPSTDVGDSMLGMRAYFAREEHKRIRQRTVGTRELLRDRGYYVEGRPPYGYRRNPNAKGADKNVLVFHDEEAKVVKEWFVRALAGDSLTKLADAYGVDKTRIHKSLRSRHYLGEIRKCDGSWVQGLHPALVSPHTWQRVQDTLSRRRNGGARPRSAPAETDTWVYRDVAVCAHCGGRMSAAYAGEPGPGRRYYYKCRQLCHRLYPRVQRVEADHEETILERLIELKDELGRESRPPVDRTTNRRAKLEAKRARYLESHAEGLMTLPELRAALDKLDADLRRLAPPPPPAAPTVRRSMLRDVETLVRIWRKAPPKRRRQVVNLLVDEVRVSKDGRVKVVFKTLESLLAS